MKILLNIQYILHCELKHYETNLGLPMVPRVRQVGLHLGDLNMTNKPKQTNNLPSWI
jgi:hypothetical protein